MGQEQTLRTSKVQFDGTPYNLSYFKGFSTTLSKLNFKDVDSSGIHELIYIVTKTLNFIRIYFFNR